MARCLGLAIIMDHNPVIRRDLAAQNETNAACTVIEFACLFLSLALCPFRFRSSRILDWWISCARTKEIFKGTSVKHISKYSLIHLEPPSPISRLETAHCPGIDFDQILSKTFRVFLSEFVFGSVCIKVRKVPRNFGCWYEIAVFYLVQQLPSEPSFDHIDFRRWFLRNIYSYKVGKTRS